MNRVSFARVARADNVAADTKTRLEDLYLPYKQKRRNKARSPLSGSGAAGRVAIYHLDILHDIRRQAVQPSPAVERVDTFKGLDRNNLDGPDVPLGVNR